MVYYVRFLKTPRAQTAKPKLTSVSALVSITTDLGDAFLAEDVALQAQIIGVGSGENTVVLHEKACKWEAGNRELSISIGPIRTSNIPYIVLAVGVKNIFTTDLDTDLSELKRVPLVISGWSAPFNVSQNSAAEKLIERRFVLQNNIRLRVWEETGNNIARHIWDAALAAIMVLQDTINSTNKCGMRLLQSRLQNKGKKVVHVIELGSGCGIVGIALAQLLPRCSVTLTDLPEVNDIMARNLQLVQSAPESASEFKVLDWEEEVDADILKHPVDLVLVSDCTYNADSLPSLVQVLDRLVRSSPNVIILVSLKRRHESEIVFFELMRQSSFVVMEELVHTLPAPFSEEDRIEIYAFSRNNQTRPEEQT